MAVDLVLLKTTLSFVLTIVAIGSLRPAFQPSLVEGFGILCFCDSMYVIFQTFVLGLSPDYRGGFLGNPSMNGCFIAVTLGWLAFEPEDIPYGFKGLKELCKNDMVQIALDAIMLIVPVVAIFCAKASVPVGVLAIMIGAYILCQTKKTWLSAAFVSAVLLAGFAFTPDLLGNSGRFGIWKLSLKWWWNNADIWTGTGNGMFFLIGPMLQHKELAANAGWTLSSPDPNVLSAVGSLFVNPDQWWIWAHNDWLQALIELGIIGVLLYLSLFVAGLWRAWKKGLSAEFAVLTGIGAAACFNFVVHSALFAVAAVLVVARIFDNHRIES